MSLVKTLQFKPYARLLTMLGDQLIKNERIALIEVIKNAYDADASWVKVTFSGFGEDFELMANSKIVIEDDGTGMTRDVLEEHWVNPATPIKKLEKSVRDTTPKGRKIQGEKGIGRFALLKLGRTVSITTRPQYSEAEFTLKFDFSRYDDDFLSENGEAKTLYLEDLEIDLIIADKPAEIDSSAMSLGRRRIRRAPHGTRIEVSRLRGTWNSEKVERVYTDLIRLQSIFDDADKDSQGRRRADVFEVLVYKDSVYQSYSDEYLEKLKVLIEDNSVFRIENGRYDEAAKEFRFSLNGKSKTLSLKDPDITGLKIFRDYFGEDGEVLDKRGTNCGPFSFGFYVFDFGKNARGKHALDGEQRAIVKEL